MAQQRRYAKRIERRVIESAMVLIRQYLVPKLEFLTENASRVATTDAQDDLGDILDDISSRYFDKWTRREFNKVVRSVADEVAKFNATQLNRQLAAVVGTTRRVIDSVERVNDAVGDEPWLQKAADEFTRENVALIKSIPTELFSKLEKELAKGIADGTRWEDLALIIEKDYGASVSRARLIARDQVSKFNGDLNRVRQQDLGISKFIWRTAGDERVRTNETAGEGYGHVERNGIEYEWSDPPEGETPGEPINCRCYADPVLESVLAEDVPKSSTEEEEEDE
jgi:SPP1 gp7 family putative phage head morphogenesis protein